MLHAYEVVIALIALLAPAVEEIDKRDEKLGRQMKDAIASVALDVAVVAGSTRDTRQRCESALGSAWEVKACLDVALAMRYIGPVDPAALNKLDHLIKELTSLAHRLARYC